MARPSQRPSWDTFPLLATFVRSARPSHRPAFRARSRRHFSSCPVPEMFGPLDLGDGRCRFDPRM
eukprot:3332648-Pyramimonas_sp.AAC.2